MYTVHVCIISMGCSKNINKHACHWYKWIEDREGVRPSDLLHSSLTETVRQVPNWSHHHCYLDCFWFSICKNQQNMLQILRGQCCLVPAGDWKNRFIWSATAWNIQTVCFLNKRRRASMAVRIPLLRLWERSIPGSRKPSFERLSLPSVAGDKSCSEQGVNNLNQSRVQSGFPGSNVCDMW